MAPAPSGWRGGAKLGAGAELGAGARARRGAQEPLPAAPAAAATRQPTRESMASELSSRGESFRLQWKAAATAVKTEGMAELRETIERLREKVRVETTEKTKAVGEAVKRGKALAALQKGHTSLQELHARVVTQPTRRRPTSSASKRSCATASPSSRRRTRRRAATRQGGGCGEIRPGGGRRRR